MDEGDFLHKVKKIVSFDSGSGISNYNQEVNACLDNGWILLNVHTVGGIGDVGGVSQYAVFILGNTDPNADIGALLEELKKNRNGI